MRTAFLVGCTYTMESSASQKEEVEFNEEGNRKLLWVLKVRGNEWPQDPLKAAVRESWTLISSDRPFLLGIFSSDGLCTACTRPTLIAWLQPVLGGWVSLLP